MSSTHSETKEDKRVAFGFWLQDQRARGGWVRHVGRTEAEKYVIGAHWFEAANLRRLYRASYVIHNPDTCLTVPCATTATIVTRGGKPVYRGMMVPL